MKKYGVEVVIKPGREKVILRVIEDDKHMAWVELGKTEVQAMIDVLTLARDDLK